jgi:hypothetical protein
MKKEAGRARLKSITVSLPITCCCSCSSFDACHAFDGADDACGGGACPYYPYCCSWSYSSCCSERTQFQSLNRPNLSWPSVLTRRKIFSYFCSSRIKLCVSGERRKFIPNCKGSQRVFSVSNSIFVGWLCNPPQRHRGHKGLHREELELSVTQMPATQKGDLLHL